MHHRLKTRGTWYFYLIHYSNNCIVVSLYSVSSCLLPAGTSSHIRPYALVFQSSTIISIAVSYLAHHSFLQWPIKASLWILPALLGTAQQFLGNLLFVPANCNAN